MSFILHFRRAASMRPILSLKPLYRCPTSRTLLPRPQRAFESTPAWSKMKNRLEKQVEKLIASQKTRAPSQKAAAVGDILIYACPTPRLVLVAASRISTLVLCLVCIVGAYDSFKIPERPDLEPFASTYS